MVGGRVCAARAGQGRLLKPPPWWCHLSLVDPHPDANHPDMETMISRLLKECGIGGIPVAFGFTVGHTSDNLPLVCGADATLEVTPSGVILSLS